MILSEQNREFDWSFSGLPRRDWNGTSVGSRDRDILTGKYGGEEDVVREGDEATLSQGVKYAVLIGKLLSLLGNLLLVCKEKKMKMMY